MNNKITRILDIVSKDKVWKIVLFSMVTVLLSGSIYYFINFPESSRVHVEITPKEFKSGKINDDITATDEVESTATFEEYNVKYKALKAKLPKAEWNLLERKLTPAEYEKEVTRYSEYYGNLAVIEAFGGDISEFPEMSYPGDTKIYTYSMKKFLDDVYNGLNIDSTDFDSKIVALEKIEHFYSLTDKKGGDTLLVKNFKNICSNSKNLSIDEIKGVEKLHNSITKTKLVFSLTKENSVFERQDQLFNLFEAAANSEITPEKFELLDSILLRLKKQKIVKDTVVILNVMNTVMNIDFSKYKAKGESVDALEIECAKLFINDASIKYDEKDVVAKFEKYISLYDSKLAAANLDKKAREILREENRNKAIDLMYFGFFFTCICVIIVQLIKQNNKREL
jgi:hypothetical protein